MSTSILQLQATGIQDVYLTKNPEINVFKYNYYRHVNFATDTIPLHFNEAANFNKKISCIIPKRGHLLSKLHLHIRLPPLVKNGGTYASWSDTLGYAIFSEPIELQIGGVVVDKLYPQFLNAWDELSNDNKKEGTNLMLLKSDTYVVNYYNAQKQLDLMIPLDFWFTKKYASALPIVSMTNQEIRINFKLRPFSECINYDGSEPHPVSVITSDIYAEYIYLDDIILHQYKKQKHMFVIEQVQYNGDEKIEESVTLYNSKIKFNYPCKEFVFFCAEKQNIDNNNHFAYSRSTNDGPLIQNASLLLDGKLRFDNLPEFYYRSIFPYNIHSTIPLKYIYIMPFSIHPEDNQPTGSLNTTRFNDITLSLRLSQGNPELRLYTFGLSYNIIIIENGILSFEYTC